MVVKQARKSDHRQAEDRYETAKDEVALNAIFLHGQPFSTSDQILLSRFPHLVLEVASSYRLLSDPGEPSIPTLKGLVQKDIALHQISVFHKIETNTSALVQHIERLLKTRKQIILLFHLRDPRPHSNIDENAFINHIRT
jgi:hypothetical protein